MTAKIKTIAFFIFFATICFMITSCKKKENVQNIESEELSSQIPPSDTFFVKEITSKFLRYNPKLGEKFRYRISTKSSSDQLLSMDTSIVLNINQRAEYILEFETLNIDNDTIFEFQVKISRIYAKASSDKESKEFDSDKKNADTSEIFNEYRAILNNPFKAKITALGKIIDVYATEKIINDYLKLINKLNEAKEEDKKIMSQALVEGSLKPLLKNIFKSLPQEEAKNDYEWTESSKTKMMVFDVENIAKYRISRLYKSKKYELASVESKLRANFEGNRELVQNDLIYTFDKPVIKGTGSYVFNFDRGLVMSSRTSSLIITSFKVASSKSMKTHSKKESLTTETLIELL